MTRVLKAILKDEKITNKDVQECLNIKSLSTVSLKINGKANFTTNEAILLKKLINEKSGKKYTLEQLFD